MRWRKERRGGRRGVGKGRGEERRLKTYQIAVHADPHLLSRTENCIFIYILDYSVRSCTKQQQNSMDIYKSRLKNRKEQEGHAVCSSPRLMYLIH